MIAQVVDLPLSVAEHEDAVVELPTPHVTACTFGGPGLDELYITTSAENREGDPLAGSLFRVVPGVRGRPVREFAG